ncbi:hypothetical protein E3N88_34709 [Mikania micrantha]|uniref:SWIM-type domain-containing protein n=1 Tax=Mikania micrantha TaxID=192012 RepID=A0A5N6LYW8_9ASTR|nr:hypothetical protein E3N88_34709 [Mikania micrantha]
MVEGSSSLMSDYSVINDECGWLLHKPETQDDIISVYEFYPTLFTMKLYYGGMLTDPPGRTYVGGCCVKNAGLKYYFLNPSRDFNDGLEPLSNDQDVMKLAEYVVDHKVINVYTQHGPSLDECNEESEDDSDFIEDEDDIMVHPDIDMTDYLLNVDFEVEDQINDEQEDTQQGPNLETCNDQSEDDSEFIEDEDNKMSDPNIDMTDYMLNVDFEVEDHLNEKQQGGQEEDGLENDVVENEGEFGRFNENVVNFYLGQEFGTKEEAKNLIRKHSVESRRLIKVVKNDKTRLRAACHGVLPEFEADESGVMVSSQKAKHKGVILEKSKSKGKSQINEGKRQNLINVGGRGKKTNPHQYLCPWVMLISKVKDSETWIVKTLLNEHKCIPSRDINACTSTFLSSQMLEQIEENPTIPVRVVQEQLQRKYEIGITKTKAYRAKVKAKKVVEGDFISQYALLWDYANQLRQTNPGTTVRIEVEPNPNPGESIREFKRIYVCLGGLKQGFKALGRDLLGLDGAFMKGPFPGQILCAVGVDNNNGIYLVCYAIVESETLSSWTWFLQQLGQDLELGTNSNFTFISDRQKGILPAISNVFPCAEHRYCIRHIHENMKGTFRGKLYKDMLWDSATSTTIPEFTTSMDKLKEFNKDAHLWLSKIHPKYWSRSHFSGRAVSDVLLNNICEVFNGKIVEGRDKPIICALEYIREYLMRRIVTVLSIIERSEGLLTPNATKQFEKIKKDATNYHVQWNGGDQYQVSGKLNHQRVVDLREKNCSCRRWEITGLPCCHAVASIWFMASNGQKVGVLESWVHPVYTLQRWKDVYSFKIMPINGRSLWEKTHVPTTLAPPKHHNQVGRPKRARNKSANENEERAESGRLSKKNTKADQDHEMLEPLSNFIMKTQSNKNKENKTQYVEESVSTTQVRPKKRKKQKKMISVHFSFEGKRLIVRCAISNLTKFIDNLSSNQKNAVIEMGFQEILCLKLNAIPSVFSYWLLRNYNPETYSINDGEREIHLSSTLIQKEIDFNKLQEYEKRLGISGQKETVDEEVEVAPVVKKERLSQTKSKQNLKLRLKVPKKKEVCTTEADKDEEMVEESENLDLNETKKVVEDVAGDFVVRAEIIRKKLDSFDDQAKEIMLMIEEAEKDFPEGSLIAERKKEWHP